MGLLRDVAEDDLPIFFEHQRDPESTRMAAFASRAWEPFALHWRKNILANDDAAKKTVVVDGEVVGNVVSWTHDKKRLVGYWIARSHWGKGVATRALAEFLEHDATRPIYAWVAEHNAGSIRV